MTKPTWTPDETADTLESAIAQAVGTASVCWENMSGTGVFDDALARAVVDGLAAWIGKHGPRVEITAEQGQPATCRVWVGDVLRYSGSNGTMYNAQVDLIPSDGLDEPSVERVDHLPLRPPTLQEDLAAVLNRHSAENGSDTPDFILASFLRRMLFAFDVAVIERGSWYGHQCSIRDCDHGDGLATRS